MSADYSFRNLQNTSFAHKDLAGVSFAGSDLRGADFTGSDLAGADFTAVRTGIAPVTGSLIFLAALAVSAISGYIAMLAGHTAQAMIASPDGNIRVAGIIAIIVIVIFIIYFYSRGEKGLKNMVLWVCSSALLTGITAYGIGAGTGMGMLYLVLAFLLVVIMFAIGTVARAIAGELSNFLFIVVALAGGIFGRSVGGGIGTMVMAISCAMVSRKALNGAPGFELLRKVASAVTVKFGTSFRKARLTGADFTRSSLHNTDFTEAELSQANWSGSTTYCISGKEENNA